MTPLYLTFRAAGKILRWHHDTAKKWAFANGLIIYVGVRPYISVYKLKQAFPDVYADVVGESEE